MTGPAPRGQIITFYSFKGGTGRTMALANVAWILASNGQRVLAVDWDLESPGLHHYFRPFLADPKLRHSRGVIDIVRDFATAVVDPNTSADHPNWYRRYADVEREAVSLTWRFPGDGGLDLLPAGAQDPAYSQRVSGFDWSNFYERLNGMAFLRAMRDSMRQQYDYVLIDSRTGLSDSAGICTVLLPDAVVNCFTLNDQSIDGAASVAEAIRRQRTGDPVRMLPVPMRVEAAEQFKLEAGRDYARYRFSPYLALEPDAADAYWGDVEIPYKPFFAYEEILAIFGERSRQEYSLLSSFERLTSVISGGTVREIPALEERERRRRLAQFERQKPLLGNDIVISYASVNRAWTDWIGNELGSLGMRVTLREIDLASSDGDGADPALESWLDPAARVLVLLSRDYVESPNAAALWRAIIEKDPTGGMLVPVRLDAVPLPAPFVDRLPAVDLVNLNEDRARQALRAAFEDLPSAAGDHRAAGRQAPRFPATQPPVWGVPQRNATFTGRGQLLEALRNRLGTDVTVVMPQALYGLGGVGKTQVAIEYAHRFAADYDLVWWISAERSSEVRSSLTELARRLDLPTESVGAAVEAVLDALRRGEPYRRWLLIYDNVDDPAEIAPYLPQGTGHVLLTSRNVSWGRQASTVEIGLFSRGESVALLRRRVSDLSADQADELAERLGDLPLAIEQAGAWLAATAMPVDTYLDLLDTQLPRVLSERPPPGYERPAAATWRLSLDRIRQQMPAAAKLLEVCAFFAAEPIPTTFFYNERFIEILLPLDPLLNEPLLQGRLIQEISRYALARVDSGQSTIQLHRLVQAVIRDGLPVEEQVANRRHVHEVLASLNPRETDRPRFWSTYRRLHQHLEPSGALESATPSVRQLAIDTVRYLWRAGDYQSSLELGEAVLARWRALLGDSDDVTTLSLRLHLGNTTRSLGRYEETYAADTETHRLLEEQLGADHPYTIMAVSSLAADHRALGRYAEARELSQEALDRSLRVLGEDALRTTFAMNNLALSRQLVGDLRGALELDRAALEIRRRTLGARDPWTLAYTAAVGRDLRDLGEFQEARGLLADAMQAAEEELGENHPTALRLARTLAVTLRKAGDLPAAHALTSQTLVRYERKFGPNHFDTLACLSNLACDQSALGDHREALATAETALDRYRARAGEDHPFTLSCENNVAIFLRRLGEHQAARPLAERVVEQFAVSLGEDHPYTLACRINLANLLFDLGHHAEALTVDRDIRERINGALGPDHPDTLA
ncbi:MAG TPA: FxSxx-COOH system tetratricopeptide repeat protein, partial [Micromonosporaceae bacterium]|nr:FxSxx-COOH system tetratricopeptide repeat protein [Micromonosporaceae bacterium]